MTRPKTSCVSRFRGREGGAGEGDEGSLGERIPDVTGEAVEVVVVAAVSLVDDHDDVTAIGKQRVVEAGLAFLAGEAELLQRREVDPAGDPVGELFAQLLAGGDVDRALCQKLRAAGTLEQLAVELGAGR